MDFLIMGNNILNKCSLCQWKCVGKDWIGGNPGTKKCVEEGHF